MNAFGFQQTKMAQRGHFFQTNMLSTGCPWRYGSLDSKPFISNIFQQPGAGIPGIAEIPKRVRRGGLPNSLLAGDEHRLEARVQVLHLIVQFEHSNYAT